MSKQVALAAAAVALLLCGVAVAAAKPADHQARAVRAGATASPRIDMPNIPRITVNDPQIEAPRIARPHVRRPDVADAACSGVACDPATLAGVVRSFDGTTLVVRTDAGRTVSARVDERTDVACPPQDALDDGRIFTPVAPQPPQLDGSGPQAPAEPAFSDAYACSADEIAAGRHVAGGVLAHAEGGGLRWVAVALTPDA